jgi:hypothetical protein
VYDTIILRGGTEEPIYSENGIPSGRLNFRFNHVRDKERGAVLSSGMVRCKVSEFMNADPIGLGGQVDVGEEVDVGEVTLSFDGIS